MAKKSTKKELRRDIRAFSKIYYRYAATKALRAIEKHYAEHPPLSKEEKAEWSDLLYEVNTLIAKLMKKNIKDREMRIEDGYVPRGTFHIKD